MKNAPYRGAFLLMADDFNKGIQLGYFTLFKATKTKPEA